MTRVSMFSGEQIPLEMHKVRVVQKLRKAVKVLRTESTIDVRKAHEEIVSFGLRQTARNKDDTARIEPLEPRRVAEMTG